MRCIRDLQQHTLGVDKSNIAPDIHLGRDKELKEDEYDQGEDLEGGAVENSHMEGMIGVTQENEEGAAKEMERGTTAEATIV